MRIVSFACAIGLLAAFSHADLAVAQGTCTSSAKPDYMSGSPPKKRSPIDIQTDPTDSQFCNPPTNNCVAPANPTVTESAPSCTCECQ